MMKRAIVILVIALTLSVSGWVLALSAGGFDLSWFSIDAGGGASNGGSYALTGTIGQPDAGALSGAGYKLAGGFWPDSIPRNLNVQNVYLPVIVR